MKEGYYWIIHHEKENPGVHPARDTLLIGHRQYGCWYITGENTIYDLSSVEVVSDRILPPSEFSSWVTDGVELDESDLT